MLFMRLRTIPTLLSVTALCLVALQAKSQVIIDFDTLPGGGSPILFAPVEDTYASLGVHFGNSLEVGDPLTPEFRTPATPGDFIIRDGGRAIGGGVGFHIYATFDIALDSIVAMPAGPTGLYASITMSAYDVDLNLLASIEVDQVTPTMLALANVGAIRSVSWVSDSPFLNSPQLDRIEFTPIPEPGTFTLVALGLSALAYRSPRARRVRISKRRIKDA